MDTSNLYINLELELGLEGELGMEKICGPTNVNDSSFFFSGTVSPMLLCFHFPLPSKLTSLVTTLLLNLFRLPGIALLS